MSDLKSSGAAFIPSVMPEIPFSQITSAVATDIANVVKKFTSEGIEVWLRFGHEMNCYVSEGCSEEKPAPYSGCRSLCHQSLVPSIPTIPPTQRQANIYPSAYRVYPGLEERPQRRR